MEKEQQSVSFEEDVRKESVDHLIRERMPWLFVGLLGGIITTLIVSRYEAILSSDIRLAFFIPVIVYLSDAVGTQTETIYIRALSDNKRIIFSKYIFKESLTGFFLGLISGLVLGIFSALWLKSTIVGFTVGLTMFINLTLAPILALVIPRLLYKEHSDPALGSGPVATIIQDLISLIIFFLIASVTIL